MSIIAVRCYDDKIEIAGDGRQIYESGQIVSDNIEKIYMLPVCEPESKKEYTFIMGIAGDADLITRFILQLTDTKLLNMQSTAAVAQMLVRFYKDENLPAKESKMDIILIKVRPDGENVWIARDETVEEITNPDTIEFAAVGSGSDFALGALEGGASAKEAVETACKYRIDCGGKCQKIDITRYKGGKNAKN